MYATFEFYRDRWLGKVTEEEYPRLAIRTSQMMDYLTFERLTMYQNKPQEDIPRNVAMCQCELIDYFDVLNKAVDEDTGMVLRSEWIDKWRREYSLTPNISPENKDAVSHDICRRYLVRPINYMYIGVI